ncbi:hypothetical protein NX722_16130 [Endozoicomonas gorgoniicola]|uniref:Uncharacterized protein n=1 Tax=Endozoicomonas gorgoniicola TaxID=1234144 RepID=A0ABT3MXK7_9GAMM|nr:hypothetical protein [Endozoicomonas gorgoniicola]MCW7554119.1 hypothetical protein [Endozoicomonas gorgoniicola]
MLTFNKVPCSNKLVIGCGSRHQHPGEHLGCDTLDISSEMEPGILGDITISCLMHMEMFERYQFILCEALPDKLFREPFFYENLDFFSQKNGLIIFFSISYPSLTSLASYASLYSWKLDFMDLSNRYLLSPFEYDEYFRMANDLYFNHKSKSMISYIAKK